MSISRLRNQFIIYTGLFRNLGLVIFDLLVIPFLPRNKNDENVVVIVRLDDIGDFVTWLRPAQQIRQHYQSQRIMLIANETWRELAYIFPFWDEIIGIDVKRLKSDIPYRWSVFLNIPRLNAYTIIQPTYFCFLVTGDSIVRMSRAKNRIGSFGDLAVSKRGWQKRIANLFYTRLVDTTPQPLSVLLRNQEFCRQLMGENHELKPVEVPAFIPPTLQYQNYFLVFPGSNGSYKIWPKEYFASLVSDLESLTGLKPILCGSESERDLCGWIQSRVTSARNLAGKTTLLDTLDLVKKARFVLSNDSAAVHLGAMLKVDSFAIVGGGHFGLFLPYPREWQGLHPVIINFEMPCYGCGWRCHLSNSAQSPFPCVKYITPQVAFEVISKKLLEKEYVKSN